MIKRLDDKEEQEDEDSYFLLHKRLLKLVFTHVFYNSSKTPLKL